MTDSGQKKRPIRLHHYISYGLYRGFEHLMRLVPMEMVCVVGGLMGSIARFLLPQRKAVTMRNLRIAYGSTLNDKEINALCRRTYWNTGANLFASFKANTMPLESLHSRVEICGLENIEIVQQKKCGCIILLAHMGSWEILAQMQQVVPELIPSAALYRPLGNPLLDRLVKRRRQKNGTKLFSKADGFFGPIGHLKKNGSLGALADQNAGSHGMAVPMYGKLTSLTNLPALLHRRTGAPIIPLSMATTGLGRWRIQFHPAIEISEDEKKNAAATTGLCAKAYETMMSTSPADVLWMHGYWKIGTQSPLKMPGMTKKKDSHLLTKATQTFKLLLFAGDSQQESEEILSAIQLIHNYRDDLEMILVSTHLTSPLASHHIYFNPEDPPHIAANEIRKHSKDMDAPIDCAIDLTNDFSGDEILELSGLSHRYAMGGKHVSKHTKIIFSKHPEKRNLESLLTSLGLYGNAFKRNK